jgi:hypothetical protein
LVLVLVVLESEEVELVDPEEVLESLAFLDSPPLSDLDSLLPLLEERLLSLPPSSFLPGFAELYRSAYQPLPFKMKPAPPET